MPDELPPPLIQDPTQAHQSITVVKKEVRKIFDAEKVLAAVGLVLVLTIIIIGLLWTTVQRLENRVNQLEVAVENPVNKMATNSAKTATTSATTSAIK